MTWRPSGTLLHGLTGASICLVISSSEVMGGGKPHVEDRILRIVRAHAQRERRAEIAVRGGEVRIDFERPLEFLDRVIGPSLQEVRVTEREMCPRVVVVELGRPARKRCGIL